MMRGCRNLFVVLHRMRQEWNGLTKPSGGELFCMTVRTIMITVISALAINAVDIVFTQVLRFVSGLM